MTCDNNRMLCCIKFIIDVTHISTKCTLPSNQAMSPKLIWQTNITSKTISPIARILMIKAFRFCNQACINCGACLSKCPYELNIPELLKKNLEDYREVLKGNRAIS